MGVIVMVATYKAMGTSFDGAYFTSGVSDYYSATSGGEPAGQWFGSGVAALGLKGSVNAEAFGRILAGNHPSKPRALVQPCEMKPTPPPAEDPPKTKPSSAKSAERVARCPAYDVTFSLPKSISVLWASGDDRVRREIDKAFDRAVRKTLRWLETNVSLSRSGRAGKFKLKSKLVIAMFDHFVNRSRTWEPHRHRHCVIANMAQRPDGSWTAVNSFELRKWIRMLGPLMGVHFAAEIKNSLGLALVRATDQRGRAASWYEAAGIPKQLCQLWSSRHADLHSLLDGSTVKMDRSTAQARDLAFQLSRQKKQHTPPIKELLDQWGEQAQRYGFDRRSAEQLLKQASPAEFEPAYRQAWEAATQRMTRSEAYFSLREFLQAMCEEIQHLGVDGDKLARRVKQDLERSPEIVHLSKLGGEMRFTTKRMWEIEERLLKNVETLQAQSGPVVSAQIVQSVLKKYPKLDDEQRAAVQQMLTQKSGFRLLTGVAGAGKSIALDVVRTALERGNCRVIGGAISGQATEELAAKAHVTSRTVESYLYHFGKSKGQRLQETVRHHARMLLRALVGKSTWKRPKIKLTKNSVLILDEIGMIDTRSLERLTHHVVKAGCTILGAGDDKQLQPVLAGGPIHFLVEKLGSAFLSKSYRQQDPQDIQAANDLRAGKAEEALANLVQRGRVAIGKDRSNTIKQLVETWVKNGGANRPQDHFVFVQTREEARIINGLLQERRLRQHRTPHLASVRAGSQRIYRGDRVMFQLQYPGIKNGYRGTVLSVNPALGRLTVRLDREPNQEPGKKPAKQVVTVSLRALQRAVREPGDEPISLAYAGTTHRLQGGSTPVAYMLVGGQMTDRQMSYTQLTRGVQKTFLFCDQIHAGDELKDLARAMNKSRAKLMAHDLVRPKQNRSKDRPTHEITLER